MRVEGKEREHDDEVSVTGCTRQQNRILFCEEDRPSFYCTRYTKPDRARYNPEVMEEEAGTTGMLQGETNGTCKEEEKRENQYDVHKCTHLLRILGTLNLPQRLAQGMNEQSAAYSGRGSDQLLPKMKTYIERSYDMRYFLEDDGEDRYVYLHKNG